MFKCQRRIYGCLVCTTCYTVSCRPMHLSKTEVVGIRTLVNLVYMCSVCVCKIQFYKIHQASLNFLRTDREFLLIGIYCLYRQMHICMYACVYIIIIIIIIIMIILLQILLPT